MKETFLLKTGWNTIFTNLSDKQAGMLIKALYHLNCDDIAAGDIAAHLSDLEVRAYFNIMTLDCINFQKKYDMRCETSRENGRMGGAKNGNQNAKKKQVMEVLSDSEKQPKNNLKQPKQPKQPDNDNDNDNDLEKEKEKEKPDAANAATIANRKDKFYQSLVPFVKIYPKEMIRNFFDYWSELNPSRVKMRFELEKTWELHLRLSTWARRDNEYTKNGNKTGGSKPNFTDEELAQSIFNGVARSRAEKERRNRERWE